MSKKLVRYYKPKEMLQEYKRRRGVGELRSSYITDLPDVSGELRLTLSSGKALASVATQAFT